MEIINKAFQTSNKSLCFNELVELFWVLMMLLIVIVTTLVGFYVIIIKPCFITNYNIFNELCVILCLFFRTLVRFKLMSFLISRQQFLHRLVACVNPQLI